MGFFSKLTGAQQEGDEEYNYEQDDNLLDERDDFALHEITEEITDISIDVDLYEDADNLYLRAFIAGVNPKELDIDVTRDTIIISGERYDLEERDADQFIQKELRWGKFQREIQLPKEIEIEEIAASIKHGVLTLRLPKLDKDRKVKVKL